MSERGLRLGRRVLIGLFPRNRILSPVLRIYRSLSLGRLFPVLASLLSVQLGGLVILPPLLGIECGPALRFRFRVSALLLRILFGLASRLVLRFGCRPILLGRLRARVVVAPVSPAQDGQNGGEHGRPSSREVLPGKGSGSPCLRRQKRSRSSRRLEGVDNPTEAGDFLFLSFQQHRPQL